MSWLSGLAGKAEDLLVRVDQAAGKALTNQPDGKPPSKLTVVSGDPSLARADARHAEATYSQPQIPRIPSTSQLTSSRGPSATQAKSISSKPSSGSLKDRDKDEDLFRFLNTNAQPAATTNTSAKNSISSGRHSRASSTSSTVSSRIEQLADASVDMSYAVPDSKKGDDEAGDDGLGGDNGASVYEPSSGYHSNADTSSMGSEPLSDMEVENHMLKKEIASLNHEIQSIIHRSKDAQEEIKHLNAKLSQQHHQLLVTEQMARDLREQNTDTQELMKAKDAQLAVLRVRLDEADRRLTERQHAVDDVEKEKRRLLEDHSTASNVHSQALTTLQEKLQRAEMTSARDHELHLQVQKEYTERHSKLESEVRTLAETVESLQRKLQEEKNKNWDTSSQLKLAKSHLDNSKQELSDYKEKAARILQAKEKLIAMLKEGGGEGSGGGSSGVQMVSMAEVDALRQEKEMIHEELQQARMTIDSLRTEIAEVETQMQQEASSLQDQVQAVEEQLRAERLRCQDAEQDLTRLKQEVNYTREESTKVKVALQTRLQDREEEISRLRTQMTTRSMNTSNSQQELENRLHVLTENLIQKQTAIESLHTERNSLSVQLERMEKQCRELEASAVRSSSAVINVNDDEAVRQRVPAFMRETPMDGNMARKVKRAANSIDRFSIWLGVFLHRFPMARIVVIVYMMFLHLWVTFVLLTYKPEIHAGDDHLPSP